MEFARMSVFARIRSFRESERGNFSMMFALALVPLLGMVGAAIDYAHYSEVRSRLANALDGGLLAVGAQPDMTDEEAFTIVNNWLAANIGDKDSGDWKLDSVMLNDDGTITGALSASVDTTLARVLGVDQLPINVTSEAIRSLGKVEVALVLDNTGSMKGTKLTKLKEAATSLVESLANATKDPADLKIALVPFSQTVNVGSEYASAAWMDTAAKSSVHDDIFTKDSGATYSGTNRFSLFKTMKVNWGGCVESRPYPYDVTEAPPSASTPDTLYVPYLAPDEPDDQYKSKGKWYDYYNNNYLADISSDKKWKGKQGNPSKYKDKKNFTNSVTDTTGAFGYHYGPNSGCEMEPIQRLTSDSDKVVDAIDDMVAIGNTHINVGLQWGWHVLSPNAPFGDGVAYDDPDWTKVVVLLTDGNNENAYGNEEDESYYSGYGYVWQNRFGTTSTSASKRTEALDDRLEELCTNMKADDVGIVIYTVRVEVKSGSSDVLKNCASEDDNFKEVADVSDLEETFANIGGSIQKLRLKK
jgi:Flp pilus assembly protein TadG